jgi:hypothetical protein
VDPRNTSICCHWILKDSSRFPSDFQARIHDRSAPSSTFLLTVGGSTVDDVAPENLAGAGCFLVKNRQFCARNQEK